MSTVTAILEPDSEGCLHLPVPVEMRGGKVKVIASLEQAAANTDSRSDDKIEEALSQAQPGVLLPVSEEAARRVAAVRALQSQPAGARGGFFGMEAQCMGGATVTPAETVLHLDTNCLTRTHYGNSA